MSSKIQVPLNWTEKDGKKQEDYVQKMCILSRHGLLQRFGSCSACILTWPLELNVFCEFVDSACAISTMLYLLLLLTFTFMLYVNESLFCNKIIKREKQFIGFLLSIHVVDAWLVMTWSKVICKEMKSGINIRKPWSRRYLNVCLSDPMLMKLFYALIESTQ